MLEKTEQQKTNLKWLNQTNEFFPIRRVGENCKEGEHMPQVVNLTDNLSEVNFVCITSEFERRALSSNSMQQNDQMTLKKVGREYVLPEEK